MWHKILLSVQVGLFVLGALAGQACFEERYSQPYPPYGYYGGGAPVVGGDYDDHHVYHDRDWWVGHDHDWVSNHHHEWLEHREAHEHKGS